MKEAKPVKESETHVTRRANDPFAPILPVGRWLGMSPFGIMREFAGEMDRVFGGGKQGAGVEPWAPAVDVRQCNGDLVITAELPGVKKDEIKVEMTDDAIVLQGERKREHNEDHEGYHRWERSYGSFYRSVPLPEGAKTDQAKAEMQDGVLTISVPVPHAEKKTRQVPIQEGAKAKAAGA